MNPLIGVTCVHDYRLGRDWLSLNYTTAIEREGGVPVPVPSFAMEQTGKILMDHLDGILFAGGADVDAVHYGEEPLTGQGNVQPERDRIELFLARQALERDIPVLGICRGAQLLNVAAGGALYQDLEKQGAGFLQHMQNAPRWYPFHRIYIEPGTRLFQIVRAKSCRVNSFHHQGIKRIASPFQVSARAADGVVEAFESSLYRFVMGVQWHPESMTGDPVASAIFRAFVKAAGEAARSKGK